MSGVPTLDPCGCHETAIEHDMGAQQTAMITTHSSGMEFGIIHMHSGHDPGFVLLGLVLGWILWCIRTAREDRYITFATMVRSSMAARSELSLPKPLLPVTIGPLNSQTRCAYCHDPFDRDTTLQSCPACKTLHHRECLQAGCSILGCRHSSIK